MSNIIPIRLRIVVRQDPQTGHFISNIPALGLHSASRTPEGAEKAAVSAVGLYLEVAREKGTLGQCLLDTGFLNTGEKQAPSTVAPSSDRVSDIDTPLNLEFAYA